MTRPKLDLRREIDLIGGKIADLQSKGNHYKRLALQKLRHKDTVKKFFEEIAPALC